MPRPESRSPDAARAAAPHRSPAHGALVRAVLLAAAVLCGAGAVAAPASMAGAAPEPVGCGTGSVALLVDGSASITDYDRDGSLRVAVGAALDARVAAEVVSVRRFDQRLGAARADGPVERRVRALVGEGARGATELGEALATLARERPLPRVVAIVTDGEPSAMPLPDALRARAVVIAAVGGEAPAWMRRLARAGGGDALALREPAQAEAFAATVAAAAGCAPAGPMPVGAAPVAGQRDVVLVSGLRDRANEVRGARDGAACAGALSLATWCRALVAQGQRVWVPSIAPRGRARGGGRATIDSTGRLSDGGAALARWAERRLPGRRPVYVGHSMGGLLAHAAVGWSGAPAAGIVTVGTPHAGSYAADAYLAAKAGTLGCAVLCPDTALALGAAAATVRLRFGAALPDLTHRRRTRVAPLPRLAAPLAAYAGAVNRRTDSAGGLLLRAAAAGSGSPGGEYLIPNDGIVGAGSALAQGTRTRPVRSVADGRARHSANVLPAGAPTQLESAEVTAFVTGAVASFSGARAARAARRPADEFPSARTPRRRLRGGPIVRRISAVLAPVTALDGIAPGKALGGADGLVVSADPLTLRCDGTPVDAIAVPGGLWVLDLGALGCSAVTAAPGTALRPPRAVTVGPEAAEWSTPPAGAPCVILARRAGGAWRITVRGVAARPRVRAGGAAVVLRALPGRGGVYRGAIGPRLARRAGAVDVVAPAADGTPLAATLELG